MNENSFIAVCALGIVFMLLVIILCICLANVCKDNIACQPAEDAQPIKTKKKSKLQSFLYLYGKKNFKNTK